MKNKDYTSICDILTKQLKRKCFPFMTFGEVHRLKYLQLYKYPIEKHYKQCKRKGFRFAKYCVALRYAANTTHTKISGQVNYFKLT